MTQICPVCEYDFQDGEDIVAIMMSKYKRLNSDVHYAITQPTSCIEIIHAGCYNSGDGIGE
jgi:hypothetical protein